MRTSTVGIALIQRFEGFRGILYRDVAGWATIGYGHRVALGEVARFAAGIDTAQALALLQQDLAVAEAAIGRLITAPLAQHQFDALVSFTFNLGGAVLQRSTLRRAIMCS